jgi:hypothetical protein
MRIGLAIAQADYPAATPPLKPNISRFRDRPFHCLRQFLARHPQAISKLGAWEVLSIGARLVVQS